MLGVLELRVSETSVVSATYETVISHGEIKLDSSSQGSPGKKGNPNT